MLVHMEIPEHYKHAIIPHIIVDGAAEAIKWIFLTPIAT